jgi:hypothetical protein
LRRINWLWQWKSVAGFTIRITSPLAWIVRPVLAFSFVASTANISFSPRVKRGDENSIDYLSEQGPQTK